MTNKIALVTGGSRGIGRAICEQLADEVYYTYVNYLSNIDKANEVVETISRKNGKASIIQADVSIAEDVQKILDHILSKHETIDLLINNAGITSDSLLVRMSEESWDKVIATNLKSVFLTSKIIGYEMVKNRSGKIINMSSASAIHGTIGQSNYVAAKAGIIGLTKTMAREFSNFNVLVNCVVPGFIETDMTENTSETMQKLINMIPLARLGHTKEVSDLVSFIASDKCLYTTGQVFFVDGGLTI